MNRRAFSLMELLVVVGIIAVLLSILMPSVSRARYTAKTTACAANLGQMAMAMNHLAVNNEGKYPSFDMPGTGGNLWDVSLPFVDTLTKQYGMGQDALFCPTVDHDLALRRFTQYSGFRIISYNVWIPRKNGTFDMPPFQTGDSPGKFQYPSGATPSTPIAGPDGIMTQPRSALPILADIVGTGGSPPANADLTAKGNPYGLLEITAHREGYTVQGINTAYADGHVEMASAKSIRPRFFGNWWNWR